MLFIENEKKCGMVLEKEKEFNGKSKDLQQGVHVIINEIELKSTSRDWNLI
jgi:hypothetical protein